MAALQGIIVRQPESAGEKLSLAVRHTIKGGVLVYRATKPLSMRFASMALTVPITRASSAGRKPTRGIIKTGVEVFGAVIQHKRNEAGVETLPAYLFVDGGPSVFHRAISPQIQPCSADLMARSTATHAIILE